MSTKRSNTKPRLAHAIENESGKRRIVGADESPDCGFHFRSRRVNAWLDAAAQRYGCGRKFIVEWAVRLEMARAAEQHRLEAERGGSR